MNPRITPKERGLLKGAVRRVFSRSELRRRVVELSRVEYKDPARPRVTKWSRCFECKQLTPSYLIEVDHRSPVVPLDTTLENMTWDQVIDNIWCEDNGLQALCISCHQCKSSIEAKERKKHKKSRK